ncbi:hypothetical protein [Evansella cellulosilytica]|uniref:Uncharacterized protein n=1 Tax=Evansella cellulosilytica (strain ATCC 21833 / DSM 2522 / FERM P-1141 / JCM 9156 / N-4) TaxID=649639 RepID=E6U063_EVAC2|nr:hypothetical protein [Evansella cellulosilytica]ADU29067.1 hypothetical protein Bcell_0786 [Evansella cellulosilytica DSM 2522]
MKTSTKRNMLCEWVSFSTDTEMYTQDIFEDLVGDEFEAMMFEDEGHDIPSYIWTTNFVCVIKRSTRLINDISILKIPRNPGCQ